MPEREPREADVGQVVFDVDGNPWTAQRFQVGGTGWERDRRRHWIRQEIRWVPL